MTDLPDQAPGQTAPDQPRWDAELYAEHAGHHRRHDDGMLRELRIAPDAHIVDLGCGVGDLTAKLAGLVPRGRVLGVDADPGMVALARSRSGAVPAGAGNLSFEVCPAERISAVIPGESVDLAISRAVLHWVPERLHPPLLAGVFGVLRPGGVLRAELGGAGQIAALREIVDEESVRRGGHASPWYFPTPAEYEPRLRDAGFHLSGCGWVRLVRQRRSFPAERDLIGFLRSQIFLAYDGGMPADAVPEFRARCEQRAVAELRRSDGGFDLDFVRLDLLVRRP
ncbi:MAG TPA: class I SAM-dependent methyltransferase [Mycobacteriales bacterium]|nr:class I SAM-dependent methyltransferase [Mycobacteriales bacterium]